MLVHIGTTTAAVCTRNYSLIQVILFLVLCKFIAWQITEITEIRHAIQNEILNVCCFFLLFSSLIGISRDFSVISVLLGNNQRIGRSALEIIFSSTVFRQQWTVYIDRILNTHSIELHAYDCTYRRFLIFFLLHSTRIILIFSNFIVNSFPFLRPQGNWLYNSTQLMSKLKIAQLKEQRKSQQKLK